MGHTVALLVEAVPHKSEGHGSITDGVIDNPSGRTMAVGWNQPLTGMSTLNISWG